MIIKLTIVPVPFFVVLFAIGLFQTQQAIAHCDGIDGPVVKAAQKALEMGNVNLVLIWVQKTDEDEVKKAFQKTLAVRKLNPQAKELADTYFFETLVHSSSWRRGTLHGSKTCGARSRVRDSSA
jgi:hypothetical protein